MHHHRRKSGHASGNTTMTDARRSVTATDLSYKKTSSRPTMTRRTTPQTVPKLGKSPRDREREWEEDRWWDEERESFPQYCMNCEKQFIPSDDQSLYCTEGCRMQDQNNASVSSAPSHYGSSHAATRYPFFSGPPEPRDIIPRASPSRPSLTHISPPTTPASHTSAVSALKSLSIRPASPTSPTGAYHSSIWPFGRSVNATSPGNSYARPTTSFFPSTYDGAYYSTGGSDYYGPSSDRPLPSRSPATYLRPKSIELVTPMLGR
ncbi:hypothetical protein BT67DRAFT_109195 [Trichocladium antarcticum]|uniref:Life-span regulatory factor domain-containing protein n=1 Tax=Trichocladium antarcticum TaxID=1450529 RepID=A0AAN6ZH74_9PEZI|nr:hypothetical protein BT67DRAFT_109195 [Trichocladium antarcticum]